MGNSLHGTDVGHGNWSWNRDGFQGCVGDLVELRISQMMRLYKPQLFKKVSLFFHNLSCSWYMIEPVSPFCVAVVETCALLPGDLTREVPVGLL